MRAFDGRGRATPSRAAAADPGPGFAVRPATTFAQLASRLHLNGPSLQRRLPDRPALDSGGISALDRPPPLQGRSAAGPASGLADARSVGALPAGLRTQVEARSGLPMSDVRVYRGSDGPARIGALAYAQGRDIHLGPGQERHLPHEAWHVVQQKQGRVRATRQVRGIAVNDDASLEREADAGSGARLPASVATPPGGRALAAGGAVQGVFDDLRHPKRKMGVEITEGTAGGNTLHHADPTATFTAKSLATKTAMWTPVQLPDAAGAMHTWYAAAAGPILADFAFHDDKDAWMKWNRVSLTEDHGEYEWIVEHPATPQPMSFYRTQLNDVHASRQAVRATLGAIDPDVIVAQSVDPAAGQAFRMRMAATNAASAQITFETTKFRNTKRVLYEGMGHGLNKRNVPNKETLSKVPPDIKTAVRASANRLGNINADAEVIMAYLYGDIFHKIAVMTAGPAWAHGLAGNAKGWRNLLPKSMPFQITLQAFGRQPTAPELAALTAALNAQQTNVINDILALFARKITSTARVLWQPGHFGVGVPDPGNHLMNAIAAGVAPPGGAAALVPSLLPFFAHHGLNLTAEYDHVRDALNNSVVVPQVVRSHDAGFAQHAAGTRGFATEDRGEVQTTFPQLASVYARIKALARRF